MRITTLSACFSLLFLQPVVGQTNKKINDKEPIQTVVRFEFPLSTSEAIAKFKSKNKLEKATNYAPTYSNTDESGRTHQHLQQFYKGLKVEFGVIITHSQNNEVYMINGEAYNTNGLSIAPTLTNNQALNVILNSKNGATYLWDSKEDAAALNYEKPTGELVILPLVKTGEVKLAYKFDIYTTEPLARDEIYVDAHSGAIIYSNPIIKHANDRVSNTNETTQAVVVAASVTGSANTTKYSGVRPIKTTLLTTTGKYVLQDDTRGGGVQTFNSARTTGYPTTNFSDIDNNWTTAEFNNANKDIGALDAHWGAEMTYDFWKNNFNRDSYDGNGSALKSYVHYRKVANTSLVNAFWNGSVMSYGDGNTSVSILTSIDVCGHEIGHGICSTTANLAYQNQSGAINEGLSDVWGACIEHYGRTGSLTGTFGTGVWKIAEDLGSSPFRSMSSPNTYGNPDTYLGTYWTTTGDEGTCTPSSTNDQCGVHNNSGVLNHWFYILTVGKSGTNNAPTPYTYSVTGIGMTKSAQITYYAERDYLTPNATYLDMRNATLEVANSLYCGSSAEVIAVTNAWYAVNVGNQYVGYATDIALKKVIQPMIVACGASNNPTLTLENTGTNAITSATISYSIDGGAATNFNWTGNISACQTFDYPLTIGALSRGTHTITFNINTTSDGNSANNTKTSLLLVNDNGVVNTINTFEATSDNLISIEKSNTNLLWQRGNAAGTILDNVAAGNSKVYGTNLSGLYPDSTTSYLVSQCYDLSQYQNPIIKFDMAYDLEADYDYINVEYTTNGGTTWNILGNSSTTTTWYNSANVPNATNCESCVGAQWTGTNATKTQYMWSMPDFGYGGTTPQSNIVFRFNFNSDPGVQNEGVLIDNFVVTGSFVLSNQQNAFSLFNISPNPSNGLITVQLSSSDDVKMDLFDIRGRKCFSNIYKNSNPIFNQEVDFGSLQKGVYLLNISSDGKTSTKKIIIE
ncbi:M4 family metallopeptidase [Flavobacterium sp. SUN052]|uniref:M4 family metallopeptidase n=1 Tax=Flavobacterium sp. SUN052 TaxID=3002441 RepID=UPI00237D9174|nr:M4 family metallopeptidase [Flavobacterium sp. SUN052]MEC4003645.1 M4 family metallopeptidase [Flavobacterium sp. SUN052]